MDKGDCKVDVNGQQFLQVEGMQETDILIIGAGIMGLSIARELARRYG